MLKLITYLLKDTFVFVQDNSIITTTTITVAANGCPVAATTEVSVPKMNKSFSEPALEKYTNGYNRNGGGMQSGSNNSISIYALIYGTLCFHFERIEIVCSKYVAILINLPPNLINGICDGKIYQDGTGITIV